MWLSNSKWFDNNNCLLLSKHGNARGNLKKNHVFVTQDINLFPPKRMCVMFYEPDNTAVLSVCTFTCKTNVQ